MQKDTPPISFVTVSHGHVDYVIELIESIIQYWHSSFELVLVDNLGSDAFDDLVVEFNQKLKYSDSSISLHKLERPRSFSVGNNYAIRHARFEYLFIINPDCRFIDQSVHQWFQQASKNSAGKLYYPRLLNSDGSIQQNFNEWPNLPNQALRLFKAKLGLPTGQKQKRRDWYFASSIVTTKLTFKRLNGFEELFPLYCEDVALCHKAKLLNIACEYVSNVKMVHHLGGEAKHKYLRKAIASNAIWRYVRLRNYIQIKILKNRYGGT
ncbi:glycosyltransferase family 2 protein [Vibrio japonicus]|uniref:Glycosyltransferase n=1 Tax=Vibrio japonicus TaxID=1824638 RepID=A0ABY5LDB0_9VIBR|nr:glycosyltransferase [Vibrio japonicus]UUM30032.1 glycosyltransferase [Vibrio japonicus]